MIRGNVSVRKLAEFVYRSGDLYPSRTGVAVEPDEGIAAQHAAQRKREQTNTHYQREVAVQCTFTVDGEQRLLAGRMDGLLEGSGASPPSRAPQPLIEEFKCVRLLPEMPDPVDRAQARLYAGLYVTGNDLQHAAGNIVVSVVYLEADTLEERAFDECLTYAAAFGYLQFSLTCFTARIERHRKRSRERLEWSERCGFPHEKFRPNQRAIARRVFQAIRRRERLLLEAPTGSGKTLALLYPSIRALGLDEQIFYLTSRNAGALAALDAVRRLDSSSRKLDIVEVTAKERICFVEGMPCDAALCEYAAGYHERVAGAVRDLQANHYADRARVESVAQHHRVCPFELSLDMAQWADVIVGDYNYVFDPMVRLQRFVGHDGLHLLVDEAHQIVPRVQSMLEVDIDRDLVNPAKRSQHPLLARRAASIDRALLALRRTHGQGEQVIEQCDGLLRAMNRFAEAMQDEQVEVRQYPELRETLFRCSRWRRASTWGNDEAFRILLLVDGNKVRVVRCCLDPAAYLGSVFADYGASVRFSGTVSPLTLYQRLHGLDHQPVERARSPFNKEQTRVLIVDDVSTYFKQRQRSLPRLTELLRSLMMCKPGRYLIALPSYAYLQSVAAACSAVGLEVLQQTPAQSNTETQALMNALHATPAALLFVVMGGSMGESLDFADVKLNGVVMVGVGLPPRSLTRDLVADYFTLESADPSLGQVVAYMQPALVKVVQAAGRLIRGPQDRGVICLIDPRFCDPAARQFFPEHWTPERVHAADVVTRVEAFWQQAPKQMTPEGIASKVSAHE